MIKQPESKRYEGNEPFRGFTWKVYRRGYAWVSVSPESSQEFGPYVLSSLAEEEEEEREVDAYEPSKAEPGLFRIFANTAPTQKSILEFANRYGRLGGDVETKELFKFNVPGKPELHRKVEPLTAWAFEILFMRAIVGLWTA